MSEWISSSFNDFGSVSTDSIASYSRTLRQKSQSGPDKSLPHVSHHSLGKALPRSRLRKQRTSGSHEDSTVCGQASSLKGTSGRLSSKGSLKADLWCDIYSPENVAELALHKRKVETISLWLSESTKSTPKHLAHILVVKGAPGIGKSTAIRLIAVSLGLELVEFISSSGVRFTDGLEMTLMRSLHRWPEHDSGVFDNSESQSLMFRSFLLRANKYSSLQFENGLDLCLKKVIFVEDVPNVFYRDASEFHTILSVKPVSPTMMAKVLYRIAASETQQDDSLHSSWPCIIGHIVESSGGDIRSAINALQFASRRDNSDDITLSTQWRPKSKSSLSSTSNSARRHQRTDRCVRPPAGGDPPTDVPVLVAKDATCFLFHALGKIFYFKRRDSVADGEDGCDLPQHLGQHHRDPLLLEPEYRERREAAVCLFSERRGISGQLSIGDIIGLKTGQHHCSADSLLTELIPYIGLTNHTLHSPGQIALMQTLTQFPRSCCRSTLETLQEKSFVGENVDDDGVDPKHVTDQQSMSTNNGSDIFTDQLASMRSSDGGLYYDDLHMDRDKNLARTSHTLKDDRDVYGIEECDE